MSGDEALGTRGAWESPHVEGEKMEFQRLRRPGLERTGYTVGNVARFLSAIHAVHTNTIAVVCLTLTTA